MGKTISIHSFRGGTGKTNTTANIAYLLAGDGYRVAVVDTDIQSPGIHVPFGLDKQNITYSLNDYLWGNCTIRKASYSMKDGLKIQNGGELFLIPSSVDTDDITRVLHEGYDVNMLNEGFQNAISELKLDYLLIDTHPGLSDDTLIVIALSDLLIIILRPDHQDYQGTDITIEIARQLEIPKMALIVNKSPLKFSTDDIMKKVEKTYRCPVFAVVPHSDDMMELASEGIFSFRNPDHDLTKIYKQIISKIESF